MKSCITINLKKDSIVIKINEDFSQEDIMYSLRKKIPELKKLYQSEKTPIVITGKVLKNREIDEIQELIKKHMARLTGQTTGASLVALMFVVFPVNGTYASLYFAGGFATLAAVVSFSRVSLPEPELLRGKAKSG